MTRRFGKTRCLVCRSWDPDHTCPSTTAVMTAAFGGLGRVVGSNDKPCWDEVCEHRARVAA